MKNKTTLIAIAALLAGAIGAVALVLSQAPNGGLIGTSGTALVGGPFKLVDQSGKPVTDRDYRGSFMLVYFGFTYCPDICPSSLQVMTEALERLGPDAKRITPIFITVDPERDTPKSMGDYVSNFFPGMVGLTGSPQAIAQAVKAYRVFAQKVKTGDGPDEYTMDHSSFYYLMGPDGAFITHFNHGIAPEKFADGLRRRLKQATTS